MVSGVSSGVVLSDGGEKVRKNIYDILNSGEIDINREYSRIYSLFYGKKLQKQWDMISVEDIIVGNFINLNKNLIKRCIDLNDFNEAYGYYFQPYPNDFDIEYLLSFLEYVYNFVVAINNIDDSDMYNDYYENIAMNIRSCVEDIGHKLICKNDIYICVENKPEAMAVAEIVDDNLSYSVLEYNHFRIKGNLGKKKNILKNMADDIEPERSVLRGINKKLSDELFLLLNKFIRHNNEDNEYITSLDEVELEEIYDEIYQIWLLAKLELERKNRKDYITKIISSVNQNDK